MKTKFVIKVLLFSVIVLFSTSKFLEKIAFGTTLRILILAV